MRERQPSDIGGLPAPGREFEEGSPLNGREIVLTGSTALMSDYGGSPLWGFASALPEEFFPSPIDRRLFPTTSDRYGRARVAPLALCKVEASLLQDGFTRDQVVIADPRRLDQVIGPDTKAIGLTTMDPLGVSFGSGIMYVLMRLMGYQPKGRSYISRSFFRVLEHPAVKQYRPKVIVGGPAVWQFLDLTNPREMGIDCIIEGEGESVVQEVFRRAVSGQELPPIVHGRPRPADEIPSIVTPSIGGIVEVTRGCGRGCRFCHPTLLAFRSMPLELIEKEVQLNIDHGAPTICLHSEEFFRYGVRGLTPDPEKVERLLQRVYRLTKDEVFLETDFTAAATVMTKPEVVPLAAEYITRGRWSYIEMGIETPSPRMIVKIMPGKVLPFRPEEYGEVVEQSIGLLNDHQWIVCATMITNMPGETEEDVVEALELVDRLKDAKALIHVLPFIPMGALRGGPQTIYEDVLADPLKSELIIKGFLQTERVLQSGPGRKVGCRDIHTTWGRVLRHFMMWASATWSIERLEERLGRLRATPSAALSVPEVVAR